MSLVLYIITQIEGPDISVRRNPPKTFQKDPQKDPQKELLDRALPSQVLAYVAEELTPAESAPRDYQDLSLDELYRVLDGLHVGTDGLVQNCLVSVEERLGKTVGEIIIDGRSKRDYLLDRYGHIQGRRAADTKVREYVVAGSEGLRQSDRESVPECIQQSIQQWTGAVQDAVLVAASLQARVDSPGRKPTDLLVARYEKQVRGHCNMICDGPEDAKGVAQEAWFKALEKLERYDPALGSFGAFVKSYARFALRDRIRRDTRWGPNADDFGDSDREDSPYTETHRVTTSAYLDPSCVVEILKVIFDPEKLPHQELAYGFCKLLQFTPSEVVSEKSDQSLVKLEQEFMRDFFETFRLSPEIRDEVMPPFRAGLSRTLGEIATHGKTRESVSHLLERVAGETIFRDYYRSTVATEQAKDIVHWWNSVHNRVLAALAKNPNLSDCLSNPL